MVAMMQIPAQPAYNSMSKDKLIEVIETQQKVIQRFYRLLPVENKKLAPGEKLAWAAALPLIDKEKPNEQGLVRLPIDKVAEQIGMSESSASRYLMNICERFEATHEVEPYTTKKGQKCNLTYIDPTDLLWTAYPDELPLPEEKERVINGNGKYCPSCRTNNLQVTTRRTKHQEIHKCDCCGYTKVTEELDDNEPLPPMEYWPPKIGEAEKGLQAGEPFEFEEKALTSAPAYDPVTATEDAQVAPAVEVEKLTFNVSLPAGKMTPGYPLNGFSLEDWLQKRIGHGQIIVSTGQLAQAAKYISKPKDYIPNIAAYLHGDLAHIYGSRPSRDDGTTWLLGFDCDTPELDGQHLAWMQLLATAGIPSVYWKRRPGRGHLEVYVDCAVDGKAFYAHLTQICPGLLEVPEVFPIGSDQNTGGVDRADFGYSWPCFYRIGNAAHECEAEVIFPGDQVAMKSTGIQSDRTRLTWLISQATAPASCIPEIIVTQATDEAPAARGLLLDKPLECRTACSQSTDVAKLAIRAWNDAHTWEEIAEVRNGRFLASWRKEKTPSVVIDPDGYYACDHGNHGSFPKKLDRFEAWCLINGLDRRTEKERLCVAYRELEV